MLICCYLKCGGNVFADTVMLPPDPDSTLFPVDVVTAIVKDPQAAFVLLGFWNFAYEKVRLVEGIIVDEIAEVNVYWHKIWWGYRYYYFVSWIKGWFMNHSKIILNIW